MRLGVSIYVGGVNMSFTGECGECCGPQKYVGMLKEGFILWRRWNAAQYFTDLAVILRGP